MANVKINCADPNCSNFFFLFVVSFLCFPPPSLLLNRFIRNFCCEYLLYVKNKRRLLFSLCMLRRRKIKTTDIDDDVLENVLLKKTKKKKKKSQHCYKIVSLIFCLHTTNAQMCKYMEIPKFPTAMKLWRSFGEYYRKVMQSQKTKCHQGTFFFAEFLGKIAELLFRFTRWFHSQTEAEKKVIKQRRRRS